MKYVLMCCLLLAALAKMIAQSPNTVPGDLLIQLKPGQNIRETVAQLSKQSSNGTDLQIVEELSKPMRIWLLHFDPTTSNNESLLSLARNHRNIETAQFNHFISLRETTPDDPNFASQWQWVNTGQGGGTPDADVDADLAWDITTGGTTANGHDIVVCVMEGTNRNHPDLQGNLWFNEAEIPGNGIDDDGNNYIDDFNGWNTINDNDVIPSASHGTQVSGMIGAKGNNNQFVTGINWDIKIMHVLVGQLNDANVVKAYTYPLVQRRLFNETGGAEGAFVVVTNASWGIDGGNPADSPLWCAFYDSLGVEGILSCGATANNNVNIDQVLDLPTACPSEYMVAVTATNNQDVRTFSGYGTTHIDVAAPGGGIVTLSTNGGPSTTSGTSFASPLTAGIIALLYSAPCSNIAEQAITDPAATALLIRDALYSGVDIVPNLVNETKYGGRVNAFNSLNVLLTQSCGPCPKAYNVSISDIIDNSASINWASSDSTLSSDLRYRHVDSADWILVQNVSSPFLLENLLGCNNYEFQLEEICSTDSSGFSNSYFFATEGCCLPPANFEVTNITNNSATASWEPVYAANSYNLVFTGPAGILFISNFQGTSFDFTSLETCSQYSIKIQTVCDTGTTAFTLPINFSTNGCGGCIDLDYCPSAGASTVYEWIENVAIASINNTSAADDGYGDFTGISTDLVTYTAYPISLTPGYAGASYPEYFVVYLDFNQDGDFNDAGEKAFDAGATTDVTVNGEIVIPGNAVPGSTRMRVVMRWNTQPTGPCTASFAAGEVEDYCVNIVEGPEPDCQIPTGMLVSDTTMTSAILTWNNVEAATDFSLRYRKTGTLPWTTIIAPVNSFEMAALEVCTAYEAQVRTNCTGTSSVYSASTQFKTLCVSGTQEALANQLGVRIAPNPFAGDFFVSFNLIEAQTIEVEISDVWGRKMFGQNQFVAAGNHQIKLSPALTAGVYFLKVKVEAGEIVKRIIKQ